MIRLIKRFKTRANRYTSRIDHIACSHCDHYMRDVVVPPFHDLLCPICKSVLFYNKSNTLDREFALVITGLLLFIPACFLPLINIQPLGIMISASIFDGVMIMILQGYPIVALLVLVTAIFIPLLKFFLLFWVLLTVYLGRFQRLGVRFFRYYKIIHLWGMPEVYLLGVLLCINNLDGMSIDMIPIPGLGFYAFVAFMLVAILSSVTLNTRLLWYKLDLTQA